MGNLKKITDTLEFWLKYSFIGKIIGMNIGNNAVSFKKSKISVWILKSGKRLNDIAREVSGNNLCKSLKNEFSLYPINIICFIVLIAIITNIALFLIFKIGIGLFGWVVRSAFLLLCASGLFFREKQNEAREASLILKLIKEREK